MGDKSAIEWTDATWNPVTGCSKVSPGCAHCYAETLATTRLVGRQGYPGLPWTPENAAANVLLRPERLELPLRWSRPRRIFVNSMSDLFHELIDVDWIARVFAVMAMSGRHTYQVLTKRPERMRELVSDRAFRSLVADHVFGYSDVPRKPSGEPRLDLLDAWDDAPGFWPLPNVWLGTSIENNRFVGRADELRATPAAVRFISAEPLLGPLPSLDLTGMDWLIAGGESGPDARPMHSDWVRDLRDRARAAGVAFLFKQWGAWARGSNFARPGSEHVIARDGRHFPWGEIGERFPGGQSPDRSLEVIRRTAKHVAGRELDGRTWDEYPGAPA